MTPTMFWIGIAALGGVSTALFWYGVYMGVSALVGTLQLLCFILFALPYAIRDLYRYLKRDAKWFWPAFQAARRGEPPPWERPTQLEEELDENGIPYL